MPGIVQVNQILYLNSMYCFCQNVIFYMPHGNKRKFHKMTVHQTTLSRILLPTMHSAMSEAKDCQETGSNSATFKVQRHETDTGVRRHC